MKDVLIKQPELEGKQVRIYFNLACKYMQERNYKPALLLFERVLKTEPLLSEANYYRGWVFYLQEHYQEAIDEFTLRLIKQPDCANAMYFRGLCYEQLNEDFEALCDYTCALGEDHRFVSAYFARGQLRAALSGF